MSKHSRKDLAVVILAAGKGERMGSDHPKVMFDLAGRPLVRHVVDTARRLRPGRVIVIVGHGRREVEAALAGARVETVWQRVQRGTGHAVRSAARTLAGHEGDVLVLLGDVPLVSARTLGALLTHHRRSGAKAAILTVEVADPKGYGRVIRDAEGRFVRIREDKDANARERAVREINSGIMVFDSRALWPALRKLKTGNRQAELYLTDVPELLREMDGGVALVTAPHASEVAGVNSFADLAEVAAEMRSRILAGHMAKGVRIVDPATTCIDHDVRIGKGTTIFPFTVVTGGVVIGKGCEVGPFAHLRDGARLADGARIGNFVEVKKSVMGRGASAKHLTYLGDAVVGAGTNVGCGTITANYDGKRKHRTLIGERASLGSGTILVAPVTVGDGAVTGAGTVIPSGRDVLEGETVVGVPAKVLTRRKRVR